MQIKIPYLDDSCQTAVAKVLCNEDLLAIVLGHCLDLKTLSRASRVCKGWSCSMCRSVNILRKAVLSSVAGGLTRTAFTQLFAMTDTVADTYPRTKHRRLKGGFYYLYRGDAICSVLASEADVECWSKRLSVRRIPKRKGG